MFSSTKQQRQLDDAIARAGLAASYAEAYAIEAANAQAHCERLHRALCDAIEDLEKARAANCCAACCIDPEEQTVIVLLVP